VDRSACSTDQGRNFLFAMRTYCGDLLIWIPRLNHAVFGKGKEGLQTTIVRLKDNLDNAVKALEGLPSLMESKVDDVMERMALTMINTQKVRAISQEEIRKDRKENDDAPGSWGEFRKTWLVPILLIIASLILGRLSNLIFP
jgi:hypothetical protein